MILFELVGDEKHPCYQALAISNGSRQYDFLRSIVAAALEMQRPFLSSHVIKALNFQVITCLHTNPGEYRPCEVRVGDYDPPAHYRVQALMDDLVNTVNRAWETTDAVALATYVLWRLNNIHPFINGNGRTARAACYFVLCVKSGGWLPGKVILPELIKREREKYVVALKNADKPDANGAPSLAELHAIITALLEEQLKSADAPPNPPA